MTLGRLAGIVLLLTLFGARVGAAEKPDRLSSRIVPRQEDSAAYLERASAGGLCSPERGGVRGGASGSEPPPCSMDLAQHAALSWLKQVDGGKYRQSWAHSAKLFKGIVTRAKWEEAVAGIRKPLGKLASRKVQSREYSEKLPGAPDGKYVVIKFDTVFERKASAIETVTSMLDSDGVWRVSGYYVL